jgi:hypothetical protein
VTKDKVQTLSKEEAVSCPKNDLEGLRKRTSNFKQNSRSVGGDLNPNPFEREA